MATRLYVGNVSFNTTEGDLLDLFSTIGKVTTCNLITDKYTNKSRGFAFVEMESKEDADKAVQELNGKDFQDRALVVNEARPRTERPPRSPRFDDGGGFESRGGRGGDRRRSDRNSYR